MRVGLDIGYSGVKMAYGSGHQPARRSIAVGAHPADEAEDMKLNGQPLTEGYQVLVDGKPWIAGVEPAGSVRTVDESYPFTPEYRALFLASLEATGASKIERLVTGLPVNQALSPETRAKLAERMTGTHYIRPGRQVEVEQVIVTPQPGGALALVQYDPGVSSSQGGFSAEDVVIVVDPGYFSVDWLVFHKGIRREASFSTSKAGEVILRKTAERLSAQAGTVIPQARVERAVRDGRPTLQQGTLVLQHLPVIEQAAREVVSENLRTIRARVREVAKAQGIDTILVTGGGARWFAPALAEAFPTARLVVPPDPVMANAVGFWHVASRM
jgi:plasmid segregation protein ParM